MPSETPAPDTTVHVQPVGILAAIKREKPLRAEVKLLLNHLHWRSWLAIRNQFAGYLAGPDNFPPGVYCCGSGWTKGRALRSWNRQLRKAGL
jgi:hypothetical protein